MTYDKWHEIDVNLYCPDCVGWDEETDSYKPKEKKQYDGERSEL